MKKRIVCLTLALMMCGTQVVSVSASREDDLREEQAWTSQQLDATYARMSALWDQKQQLEGEIATLDANLVDVMVNIQTLETDISNKETEIVKTKQDLGKAQKAKEKQYDAMKKRIQYLYEKGGSDAWFQMMMNADNLADLLTRAEYTQKMYEQDRKSLEVYSNTIEQVKQLEEKYTGEKAELEGMKQEYEAESQNLQAQLDEKRATSADCENEIAYAQQQATEYANLLAAQQAEIEQLEAERIAAEEEARRQAEAAAAAQASNDGDYDSTQYDEEGNAVSSSESSGSGETQYDEYGNVIDSENTVDPSEYQSSSESSSSDSSSSSSSSSSGSGSGSSVVNYATQFVGNPYVWGGTSLTGGADCSGFVQSVYANFGVSLPRTSYEQQNAGTEVSYADAQPGDLICYGGHVAIYMGNGQIVHASNAKDGIKISNNAAYRTITSVRRLV
ncbi:C40 family peptidase [Blautia ammoniilytica]|uniref:NlpC/P60 family protein n=1 Tax=Blautia ammoniilytica TaxID=2981782 RepID=A0ABT2TNQ2_9FIRM|nr:C40 family peptidase [Blautia ammoniilytica]MCU6763836.1 NlpC/P60 family protein [Blautia ammoniilytica]SCG94749.1 Probable endopeptidase Spr precursor [uncultured Blautia sp.]